MGKMKRSTLTNKLDKLMSQVIRSRGSCAWCGNNKYELLQCCHIYSRSNRQVRWDRLNLLCLCAGCHFRAHKEPTEFTEFVKEYLGEQKYIELRHRANGSKVWANYELQDLLDALEKDPS